MKHFTAESARDALRNPSDLPAGGLNFGSDRSHFPKIQFPAYAKAFQKPASNGEYTAIFENIYCTWTKIE